MVLVWFPLVLVPESSNQNQTMEHGLVWFGFGLNPGLPTYLSPRDPAHIVRDFRPDEARIFILAAWSLPI
jgi:hypothetical protein